MDDIAGLKKCGVVRESLTRLVRQVLGAPPGRPLPADARLAELGMSSLKLVNLMLAMEAQFDLSIPQDEITPANFESIASVETLIDRLRRAQAYE